MISYYITIVFIKIKLLILIYSADNNNITDFAACYWLWEKLIYLIYKFKPNTFFVVGKYNFDLKFEYLCIIKQVLCYLKTIINLGIIWRTNLTKY